MSLSQKCYYCRYYVYNYEDALDIQINDRDFIERYGPTALAHVRCLENTAPNQQPHARNTYINIDIDNNSYNTQEHAGLSILVDNSDNEE
jgi:hypothetical protein